MKRQRKVFMGLGFLFLATIALTQGAGMSRTALPPQGTTVEEEGEVNDPEFVSELPESWYMPQEPKVIEARAHDIGDQGPVSTGD